LCTPQQLPVAVDPHYYVVPRLGYCEAVQVRCLRERFRVREATDDAHHGARGGSQRVVCYEQFMVRMVKPQVPRNVGIRISARTTGFYLQRVESTGAYADKVDRPRCRALVIKLTTPHAPLGVGHLCNRS